MLDIRILKRAVDTAISDGWDKVELVEHVQAWCDSHLQTASVEQPLERQEGDGVWTCPDCGAEIIGQHYQRPCGG